MIAICLLMWSVHAWLVSGYVTWYPSQPSIERFLIDEDYNRMYIAEVNVIHSLSLTNFSLNQMSVINNTPSDAIISKCTNSFFKLPQFCQYNHYSFHISTVKISLNRTVSPGLGTFNTSGTFITCSSNYSSPACQYRNRSDMSVLREVPGSRFTPYDVYSGTSSMLLSTGTLLSGTPFDDQKTSFGLSLSTYPFNGIVGLTTVPDDDTWINRIPSPIFVSMYEIGNYAYVFFWEKGLEAPQGNPAMYSRVAQICKNDTGAMTQTLVGLGTVTAFTTFVKARITCSSSSGNMNDLPYYYDNLQSTFLVNSGSFDGSQTSQMHLYGVFTSPSFGPVGSAVCVFNYGDIASTFQTSSFLVRDPTTLLFSTSTGTVVNCVTPRTASQATTYKLLSTTVPQAQGTSPIFSATGYTFKRIEVDQVKALDNLTYDVMFIAAFSGDQLLVLKMTYVASRAGSLQYTSRSIPVGTSAEWVVQMSLSTSSSRPKAVYLATNARLTVIPVDDCSAYTSCSACVGARDPYCAYDTLTMMCVNASSAPRQNLLQDVVMGTSSSCPTPSTMTLSTSTSATTPNCPVCTALPCASTSSPATSSPATSSQATSAQPIVTASPINVTMQGVEVQKEQAVNVTWIGVAGSLGFVAGIIIGIIMAAAIVNRRKFRWYDLCFPQSDNHGNEKGANGVSKDSDGEEKKHPHSSFGRSRMCAVNALAKEEELERNNNQVKVLPHPPPVQRAPRYELHPLGNNGVTHHHAPLGGSARDPNIKLNNTVQEPISNNEKERYRHNFLARGNSLVESTTKVLLPGLPHGGISVSYTAGVGVHIPGAELACSDC